MTVVFDIATVGTSSAEFMSVSDIFLFNPIVVLLQCQRPVSGKNMWCTAVIVRASNTRSKATDLKLGYV
jgi:hypothetical protein